MDTSVARETLFLHHAEMGIGTWAWGDRTIWNYGRGYGEAEIAAAFQVALEAGINLFDTAEVYGMGRSERLLGRFIQATDRPVLVATKFMPFPWRWSHASLRRALRGSLERLGLEKVDLYQIHWPLPPKPIEHWADALAEAVEAGLTRCVGVSNYSLAQMLRAWEALARRGIPLASNQVEYHLLNRSVEKNGLLEKCRECGIRLIAYSPLAKGLLTGKYSAQNPPPGVRGRMFGNLLKNLPPLLDLLTQIGQAHGGKTPSQVALNWIICKGALPIPGVKTAEQATQNVGALGWRLSDTEIQALDEASERVLL